MIRNHFGRLCQAFFYVISVSLIFTLSVSGLVHANQYGCGLYGAGSYQDGCIESATRTGGSLANTGDAIPLLVAILLLIIGIIGHILLRKKHQKRRTKQVESMQVKDDQ